MTRLKDSVNWIIWTDLDSSGKMKSQMSSPCGETLLNRKRLFNFAYGHLLKY